MSIGTYCLSLLISLWLEALTLPLLKNTIHLSDRKLFASGCSSYVTGANQAFQTQLATKPKTVTYEGKSSKKFGMPNFFSALTAGLCLLI